MGGASLDLQDVAAVIGECPPAHHRLLAGGGQPGSRVAAQSEATTGELHDGRVVVVTGVEAGAPVALSPPGQEPHHRQHPDDGDDCIDQRSSPTHRCHGTGRSRPEPGRSTGRIPSDRPLL